MNWLFKALSALPYVIAGIQQIHADAKGADKKTIAMESLGLTEQLAMGLLPPAQSAQAAVVSNLANKTIDNLVESFHALNVPGFGVKALPPAPPATAA